MDDELINALWTKFKALERACGTHNEKIAKEEFVAFVLGDLRITKEALVKFDIELALRIRKLLAQIDSISRQMPED